MKNKPLYVSLLHVPILGLLTYIIVPLLIDDMQSVYHENLANTSLGTGLNWLIVCLFSMMVFATLAICGIALIASPIIYLVSLFF